MKEYRKPTLTGMVPTALVVLTIIAYLGIAINTQDILWAWPIFSAEPSKIVIHCYGTDIVIDPRTQDHRELADTLNQILSGRKRWDPITMSSETYRYYLTSEATLTVEYHYQPDIGIHTWFKHYRDLAILIVPLDGRHAAINPVFGRTRGKPAIGAMPALEPMSAVGAMIVNTTAPLLDHIQEQGLCQKP